MFNLYEELTKIEIILNKEIEVYKIILEDEERKVNSIIDTRLQDVHMYCDHQNEKMKEANELRKLRENITDLIILNKFPHLSQTATLSDIIRKIPLNKTSKISSLRLELVTLMARLKHLNKLAPKLFDEALDFFTDMKEVLNESKKIGYNNKGKEHLLNKKLSVLINKQV
ncbi:flagellar export chaperone FlgN [Brachyspira sp. SAP_772]|uniref:flagellar export chaperone FlgN n=1 Tax=Brachyspira sp. SAP_772 TaxID=2608385 RepID=UPI0012F4DB36|nr:flagellar export chaperone FlgN [Brachyspira sp. SAP_772]